LTRPIDHVSLNTSHSSTISGFRHNIAVVVGSLEIQLKLAGTRSLKDKRRIIRSLMEKSRNEFHVAIAEVDDQDLWGNAALGVACVSNDPIHVESILGQVVNLFDEHPEVEVANVAQEIERR